MPDRIEPVRIIPPPAQAQPRPSPERAESEAAPLDSAAAGPPIAATVENTTTNARRGFSTSNLLGMGAGGALLISWWWNDYMPWSHAWVPNAPYPKLDGQAAGALMLFLVGLVNGLFQRIDELAARIYAAHRPAPTTVIVQPAAPAPVVIETPPQPEKGVATP